MRGRTHCATSACFIVPLCSAFAAAMAAFSGQAAQGTAGKTIYVNAAAPAGGDGRTWNTAFHSLAGAFEAAERGDAIWVAAGTYYPTADANRDASFALKEGVSVHGGFLGTETHLAQRDWDRNRTVLSGDIGQKGVAEDNVYHVVRGADDAALDGFAITGGYGMPNHMPPLGGGPPAGPGFGGSPGGNLVPGPGARRPPWRGGPAGGPGQSSGAGMINYQAAPAVGNSNGPTSRRLPATSTMALGPISRTVCSWTMPSPAMEAPFTASAAPRNSKTPS